MSTGFSNPQFTAINYVLDFSVNVMHPQKHGVVMERNGPNANSLPAQGKNQVLADFNECLQCNPQLMQQIRQNQNKLLAIIPLFVVGIVLLVVLSSSTLGIFMAQVAFVVAMVLCCIVNHKSVGLGNQWRLEVVTALQTKLSNWKAMYPAFTFTIIYPVEIWRRSRNSNGHSRNRKVAIWLYVRITQGPCQTGHNEPVFATTTNVVGPAVGVQPVMMQQQMVMQQQMNQPVVMVQGANGQMVQGTPAMMNGQQVIVVQQQPQVIVQQPQRQPVVIVQQQQQPEGEALPAYPGT